MLFSSAEFIFFFLPAALIATMAARCIGYRAFLLVISLASIFLYAYNIPIYVLILLVSAFANYILSGFIVDGNRKWLYVLGICANLALLGYYKYADFFLATISRVSGYEIIPIGIILPLAISFITFEQIAFLSDVRSGKVPRGEFLEYLAFITLFPKLIAGPIIRYTEILPQIRKPEPRVGERAFTGLCIFSFGLFNKVVIADSLAPIFDGVHELATKGLVSASDAVLGILAYSTRIYFDFSAYSTMAIGLAWIFGVRLPINFLSPYRSTSVIEFWRRWHITLSRFLRDYLYIPLGGGRRGPTRRYVNLMLVMILGGLWHGAAWAFVVWGFIHGLALTINHGWRSLAPDSARRVVAMSFVAWPLTMLVVIVAWVFFGSQSLATASNIFASLGNVHGDTTVTMAQVWVIIGSWVVALVVPNAATIFQYKFLNEGSDWSNLPTIPVPSLPVVLVASVAFVVSLIFALSGPPNAFIYFQF